MRLRLAFLAASILACGTAHAQNDQVQRGPTPDWVTPSELMPVPKDAAGLIFVRRQDSVVHLDATGQEQYVGYRLKILHPNALQLGNLAITWNPAAGAPRVHVIKIYRDAEVIDVLQKASFDILRREDQLEAARLDGNLTAALRIADLRVGDELEVGFTTRSNDPTLGNKTAGILVLSPAPSPGRYGLGVVWEPGRKPLVKMSPEMAGAAKATDRSVQLRFDNPRLMAAPSEAPPRYQWQRLVEYSDFADWAAISRYLAPLFLKASTLNGGSPVGLEARRIAAAHPQALDRARAALKLVQQDVRYVYVGLNGGNLTPAAADETWQRRYGDCKGKTALLLALLRELGIEATPVLVNTTGGDDGFDARLPNPGLFDHVLVRARIDGRSYWLDGTLPPVVPPTGDPTLPYRWVLPLTTKGDAIEHLTWRPAQRPDEITLIEIDARSGFDQPARVTNTNIVRGIKGLQQQVQLSGLTPDQLLDGMRQQIVGATWRTVDDVTWRYDQSAQASILTIKGTWKIDWDNDGGDARSFALPGGGFSPPDRRARADGQDQSAPFYNKPRYDCDVTTIRLPSSTKASQWSFKPGYDTHIFGMDYYRAFDLRDDAIRMVRGIRVEQQEVDAATARRDNDRIAAFDNSMAWVFYSPKGYDRPPASKERVPATYDGDWTADTAACTSASAIR